MTMNWNMSANVGHIGTVNKMYYIIIACRYRWGAPGTMYYMKETGLTNEDSEHWCTSKKTALKFDSLDLAERIIHEYIRTKRMKHKIMRMEPSEEDENFWKSMMVVEYDPQSYWE